MPIILESSNDIRGGDYTDFLDMALDWFSLFSLVWRGSFHFDNSADDIRTNWRIDRRFEPQMPRDRAAELRATWSKAVERTKGWA